MQLEPTKIKQQKTLVQRSYFLYIEKLMEPQERPQALNKWNEPFGNQYKSNFIQIEPTTYENIFYDRLLICYDRDKHKNAHDILNELRILHKLPETVDLSLFLYIDKNSKEPWRQLQKVEQIYKWINLREKTIKLRLKITKKTLGQVQEGTVILHGENYFNENRDEASQICFVKQHLNGQVVHVKYLERLSIKDYVNNILPGELMTNYQFFLVKFSGEIEIGLDLFLFMYHDTGKYIDWGAVIEIRKRNFNIQPSNRIKNLRIKGADVSIQINYEKYKDLKCENICYMADLQLPQTYALMFGSTLIKGKDKLSNLNLESSLHNSQIIPINIRLMTSADIYLWQLGKVPLDSYLETDTLLELGKINQQNGNEEQKAIKSLRKAAKIQTTVLSIEKTLTNDTELPVFLKNHRYFKSFTAYTSVYYYSMSNRNLRNRQFSDLSNPDNIFVNFFALAIDKNLQLLPYEYLNIISCYRGVCVEYPVEVSDIIETHQFLSSSKSQSTARNFVLNSKRPYTIINFQHYSGRWIEKFSAIDQSEDAPNSDPEREVLFPPHTKFIVRKRKKIGLQLQLTFEQLPSVRNSAHKHIIWIDEKVDDGIQMVNRIRKRDHPQDKFRYISTDILPFRSNEILQLWLEIHGYYFGDMEKTVVVFTLPEDIQQRQWRLKFIKEHFGAIQYVCLGQYNRNKRLISESSVSFPPSLKYFQTVDQIQSFIQKFSTSSFSKMLEQINISSFIDNVGGCCTNSSCQLI